MDVDWRERIDSSFGGGPELPQVATRVAAGRAALRRRRIATGAGTLAVVTIVGAGAWWLIPGTSAGGDGSQAAGGVFIPSSPTVPPSPTEPAGQDSDWYARYTAADVIDTQPGWEIVETVPNPLDLAPPATSAGLEVTNGDQRRWMLLTWQDGRAGAVHDPADKAFDTLQAWLAETVATIAGDSSEAVPVEFVAGTSELRAVDGGEIVEQVSDPDVPGFAEPGDPTAAAQVRWRGEVLFVIARVTSGSEQPVAADVFTVQPGVLPEPTMEAFLDHARAQYAQGEGLR